MNSAEPHAEPEPTPSQTPPVTGRPPKGEPHPAIPQEDDPEIEKTEEQPS